MLSFKNRLKKRKEINKVFKEGKSADNDLMIVKAIQNNRDVSRFAFIIPAKIFKRAVDRNNIRRRLREAIREGINEIKEGYDIVLIAKPGIKKSKFEEIRERSKDLFCKINISKE